MNIIRERQDKRRADVTLVQELIKTNLREEKALNRKELVVAIMSELTISRRTAGEYLDVALYNEGINL